MSHTSRLSYFLITFSYSPSPLSTASIIAFMASSSSSPVADKLDFISRFHACSKDTQYTFRICRSVIVIHEFYFAFVSACYVTEHPCRSEMQSRRICYCNFLSDHNVFSPFLSVIRSGRSDCFHLSLSDCCSGFPPVFYCSALSFQA